MPKRKIRHATVQYFTQKDENGRPRNYETAFRGQIVDIPADQVERLDSLGATVPTDQDLERPGRMLALPDTATDAEITSWVMGATEDEVKALVASRPVMAARIESAAAAVKQRFSEQNLHLGGLKSIADDAEERQRAEAEAAAAAAAATGAPPVVTPLTPPAPDASSQGTPPAPDATTPDLSAEQADEVVKANAKTVSEYISQNPRFAGAVLEAEGRLAVSEKRDPRTSVVRAAEAAAGFTSA